MDVMRELQTVGLSPIRPDSLNKAMGKTTFADDMAFPRMAHASVFFSPCAHGRIRSLDFSPASAIPGTLAIIGARDIPGRNRIPLMKDDWIFLASDRVVFAGEPIALVVAETQEAADEAVRNIRVEFEKLQPILDPEDSIKPETRPINMLGNILSEHKILRGNIEQGFDEADVVVEGVYETGYQEHAYLETLSYVAVPGPDSAMSVYGTMQCPFYVQSAVAAILGKSESEIHIIQTPTGGAFGGKEDMPSLYAGLAALGAHLLQRPVKLTLSRRDDMIMTSKRHPARCYYRTGARKNGSLVACEARIYLDAGAYATLSPAVLWRCAVHSCGPYRIPNVRVNAYACATNKSPSGAFRGFGSPQVIFAMERQMDDLARILEMDPLDMRLKNILRQGDVTVTGQELPWSVGLEETVQKARWESGWDDKRTAYSSSPGRLRRGIGCSTFYYGIGLGAAGRKLDRAEAYVQIKADGSVIFAVGTTDMGQGMQTVLSQILSEALGGLPIEMIRMLPVDTTRVSDSGPTVASRATYTSGNALVNAAERIMAFMKPVAACLLQCDPGSVALHHGHFLNVDDPSSTDPDIIPGMPFSRVAAECHLRHINLSTQGYYDTPDTSWNAENGQGKTYVAYSYATHIAEVEVDMETGQVRPLRFWAAHDVGRAVNPREVSGQIEGGVVQGLGYSLMEFVRHSNEGLMQNPSFSTYIIPTSKDIPEIHPLIIEAEYPEGPFGVKGFGETPLMGVGGAIANAVVHATSLNINKLPILPETLLEKIIHDL